LPGIKKPREGSLAFYPRVRAARIYPAITSYPEAEKPKVLGFAGYKAAMLHAIAVDNIKGSPSFGQEISIPVTVLDCPPLKTIGIRAYQNTVKGLKVFTEALAKDLPKELERKIVVGELVQKKRPTLVETVYAVLEEAKKSGEQD
jgi:large subunit ribosomal protein L3